MTAAQLPDAAIDLLLTTTRSPGLAGKVLGLIGYGTEGREIARRAARRGMKVLYTDTVPGRGPHQRVQLGELLARSDFIMPISGSARRFSRADLVALMKPGARLVELASARVAEHARQPHDDAGEGDHQRERRDERADQAPALADDLSQWNAGQRGEHE
jgi:phosphoglycerate dehydrogenase-like enzyme